jgi:hypothetical protein
MVAVPVLWGAGAQAQPADSVPAISFTGGCAPERVGSVAEVVADPAGATVAAGGELRFVNRLGTRAMLILDGDPAVEVPAGGAVAVAFHEGPVAARMRITCPEGERATTVMIEVGTGTSGQDRPSPAATVPPTPAADPAPVAPVAGSGSGGGPNGLLALVATVCVAGVSAGAIRAVLARRAAGPEAA